MPVRTWIYWLRGLSATTVNLQLAISKSAMRNHVQCNVFHSNFSLSSLALLSLCSFLQTRSGREALDSQRSTGVGYFRRGCGNFQSVSSLSSMMSSIPTALGVQLSVDMALVKHLRILSRGELGGGRWREFPAPAYKVF